MKAIEHGAYDIATDTKNLPKQMIYKHWDALRSRSMYSMVAIGAIPDIVRLNSALAHCRPSTSFTLVIRKCSVGRTSMMSTSRKRLETHQMGTQRRFHRDLGESLEIIGLGC